MPPCPPLRFLPVALLGLALLSGCGSTPTDDQSTPGAAPLPPGSPRADRDSGGASGQAPAADLIPLPTPQTVLRQVPIGRTDPFAPLQGPSSTAALTLPAGFRLRGVLRVSGRDQAFVQSIAGSGVVCTGPRGRCSSSSEPLLPPGTAVVAIQHRPGCITVAVSGQRQRYCLQES